MPLFLLNNITSRDYDCFYTKLVRAPDEQTARDVANQRVGDEGHIWTDPAQVSCSVVADEGPAVVIIDDFRAG